MKIKWCIVFSFLFMIVYVALINVIALYTFTIGTSRPGFFTKAWAAFTHFPLNPIADGLSSKQFLVFQILDGIFWGIILYVVTFWARRSLLILKGRKSNSR